MSDEQAPGDEIETPADADAERARLVAKVEHSLAQLRAGRGVSHAEVVAMIEQRYPAAPGEGSASADAEAERAAFVAAVEAGLADIAAGRVHTHAEVREVMAARFGRPDRATLADVTDEAKRILEAAMALPDSERAMLAAVLTDSLGDGSTPEEIEAAWLLEVKRRIADLDSGRSVPVPWEEVRQELHAKIERARGRRASAG
jgi:putative addiction module component (TIGR02574 family)